MQICEVHATIASGSKGVGEHIVAAVLQPDAGRAYKIDGRNRTGKEVKVSEDAGLIVPYRGGLH